MSKNIYFLKRTNRSAGICGCHRDGDGGALAFNVGEPIWIAEHLAIIIKSDSVPYTNLECLAGHSCMTSNSPARTS